MNWIFELAKTAELGEKMKGNLSTIYLVRHGLTEMNEQNLLRGWSDVDLSEKGKKQAEFAATFFEGKKLSRIYCSDLRRTMETAEYIAKVADGKLTPTPNLRPIEFGDWQGKPLSEIEKPMLELEKTWKMDPNRKAPNAKESFAEFQNRSQQFLELVLREMKSGESIGIVAHLRNMIWILAYILNNREPLEGEKIELLNQITQDPAAVSVILYNCDTGETQIEKTNLTHHL
jgi:broad specificity phosphatase PhoE